MEDTCSVCSETLEWVAYGECGHRVVCSTCVARLRFICHDPRCCICKTESSVVFVTKVLGDSSRMINDFSVLPSEPKEGRLGLYWYHDGTRAFFDDVDHYRMIKAMFKLSCSVCDKMEEKSSNASIRRGNFRNIEQLKGHLHHNHGLLMCSLCLEGRKVFICEQKLYTRSQLNQHIDIGDSEVDGSESERGGFMGHPICEFCKTPFYGDNELYTHMSTEHYTCFICQRQHPGQYVYFKNYDDLEIHFHQEHFLCEDEDCLAKKFVVFQSETEMKRHSTLEHGGRMSRSKRNAALQVPTSFCYWRSNKQDRQQGRARNFHRDFSEDQISMAIQASLDTANADSIHNFSSSVPGPQVTTDHGDATDIDKVTYPRESLSVTTRSCPAARCTRGLGTPFDGGRRTSLSETQAHKTMMAVLSLGEKLFIQGGIAQDIRNDGRRRLDYRPLYVETGVIPQANGSARVRFGGTDVIVSVKAEIGRPSLMQPDKGKVSIHVDCSPTAMPVFEGRGGKELSSELSLALQRCLLGGKSGAGAGIDLSSLIIVEGKVCWDLYIDGLVISSDGNLLDALGAAIKAALTNTAIPRVQVAADAANEEQPEVDISDEEFLQFDTSGVPVIVTLTKVGRHSIVDATPEEESQMSSAVSVSVHRKGLICGLTKRGSAGLDPIVILDMISVAKHVSEQFINKLDSEISAAKTREVE